ncbi:MAG: c-type cytochrome [Longimicrobiales bacterium]
MRWRTTATALALVGLVTACGESEPDDAADSSVIERAPGPAERGDRPMGDRMGERHDRMMGGGEAGEAPAATPASASAPGCPDIDGELVDRGREVFDGAGACYTCHGGDATGSQLGPDLTDGEWLNVDGTYASIADVVRTGVSDPVRYPAPMPPMGGANLSEAEACAAAGYVYSLSR